MTLTKSFNKGEVSADEFSRRVESIMGEAGFERQGDTFVTRGSIEVDPGNKTELRDSGGAMGRDGRTLQEVSGNQPSGPGPDRRIAETGEGVWQGNKEGRKRAQEYAAAGGREAAAGGREAAAGEEKQRRGELSSEIRRVRFKNERLEGKLGDLRTRQGEAVGREETARRRSVDAGTRVRERIQDVNYVGARLAAVSKIENSFALRVEVNVDWTKGDVQVKDVFDTLRNETASKGVSHNWLGGLDPFTAHPGVTKPAVGMVKATTAEIGENAGEIIIYSARDSLSAAENYRSVDRTRLASNARGNRFWAALYGAEDRVTAASEVMGKKGAPDPTHFNVYRLDLSKARVLDLTDPAVAKSFGYEKLGSVADKTKAYPVSQDVAQKARLLGYDVIKVPSVKTGKSNWDVLDNFETLVKEVKTRPGIEAATPDVVSQAKAIVFPPAPSTAESTKNLLMLGGGSLLMGGFGKNTHAKGEESKIASPEVRAAQTMGTLGIGTVVNSLRGVDLGAATSKTLDAGARVWDITKAIGTKIWDNAKSFTQDAGIIMSHTWNSSPSQDEIKPTFIPSAEVQAPLPTLNLMEFSPAKATPPTDSFDNHSDGQKGADYTNSLAVETLSGLLGPMPSTPSEVVTAGWDSLPVPFKPQAILVASAMGFNAYGEGRDYHVVGSNQQGHGVGVWKSIASIFATMTGAVRSIFVTSFSKVADWLTGRSAQGLTLKGGELYAREGTKPVKLQTARGGTIEVMAGEGGKIGKLEQGKIILGDGLTVNGVPVLSGTMTMKGGTGRIESLRLPMGKVGGMEVPGGVYRLDGQGKGWLELPGQSLGLSGGTLTLAAESVTSHDVGLEMAYIGGLGTWLSPEGENFSFVRALVIKGDAGGVLLERKGEFFVAADGKIESVTSIAGRIQENAKVAVADVGAVKALEGRIGAAFGKLGIDNATEKAGQGIKAARLEAERNLRTAEIWTNLGESEQWEMAALVSGGKMDLGRWETRVASLERGVERLAKAETLLKQVEGGLTERGLIRAELQEVKGKGEGMFRAGIRDMVKSEFSDTQDTLRAKAEWANNVVERGVDFALAEREARNDITAPTDKGRVTRLIKWPGFLMEKMLVKGVDLSEDLDTLAAQGDMDAKLTEAFNVFRIAKWGYDKTAELYDRPTGVRVASVWFGLVGRGALEVANWIVPVVRLGAVTAVVVEHHTEKAALRFGMEKEDAQKWGGWLGLGSGILLFAGTASATTKASAFLNPNVRGAVGESARSFTLGSGKEFAQALGITTGIVVAVEGGVELGGKALGWTRLQIDDGKEVGFMIAGNVVARVLQRQASRLKVQAEEKMKLALAEEMAVRGPRNELRLNLEKRIESVMSSGGGIPAGKTEYNGRLYTKLETKTPAGMLEHNGRLYKALGDGKQTNPRLLENLLSKGGLNANAGRNSQLAEVEDLGILLQRARASGAGFERARREVRDTGTEVRDTGTEVRRRNERVQRYRDEAGAAYAKALRLERMAEAFDSADTPEGWEPPYSRLSLPGGTANTTSGTRATNLLREAQSIINAAWDQNANRQRSVSRDPQLK
jgi:hypothetical protein